MDMQGKVSIVTGAGRGIGRCIAETLAAAGSNVVVMDVNEDDIREAVEALKTKGVKAEGMKVDVSNPDEVNAAVEKVLEAFERIDVLVNNAGITRDNLLLRMSDDEWDAVIAVNLKGTFNMTRAVGRVMLSQRSGSIVNIASVSGVAGNAGQANYSASKAGVIGLTKTSARELARRNIRVNAVAPGFIQTKMTDVLPEPVKDKARQSTPMNRFGQPDDVADTVLFLASDRSGFITGQVLNVDGGMVM